MNENRMHLKNSLVQDSSVISNIPYLALSHCYYYRAIYL